jgi:hypothetical protein
VPGFVLPPPPPPPPHETNPASAASVSAARITPRRRGIIALARNKPKSPDRAIVRSHRPARAERFVPTGGVCAAGTAFEAAVVWNEAFTGKEPALLANVKFAELTMHFVSEGTPVHVAPVVMIVPEKPPAEAKVSTRFPVPPGTTVTLVGLALSVIGDPVTTSAV